MSAILHCDNISFTYKNRSEPSISGINLRIEPGDFILCTGATGCGKSTLLKALNGLIPHEIGGCLTGRVLVDGVDSRGASVAELSRTVALMFQNPDDQIFSTTVADEVGFALENLGMQPPEIAARVAETLAWVGLAGREKNSVHALSGGERQRLALAAVLAVRPKVLVLDEPISQLDPRGAVELLAVLEKLNQEHGVTVIVVEHRLHEVMPLCRHVMVMEEGKVAWFGSREEAFCAPEVFLRLGLRIPQTIHICYRLGIPAVTAALTDTVERIRCEYPNSGFGQATISEPCHPSGFAATPFLNVQKLEFHYEMQGRKILSDINLAVPQGQFVALMGNNGAGKSTLLQHICGLLPPQSGQVSISGKMVRGLDRRVGMVMQNPDLMLFNSTVEAEVNFGRRQDRGAGAEDSWRDILERIGLTGLEKRFPLALSQGQRVRVAIASVLACRPELFLLDEPTTGQDLGHIDDIIALLQDYAAQGGTVILCTHDTEVAARYAERIVVMTEGRIVADAPPREIFAREEVLTVAGLRSPLAFRVARELYGGDALSVEEVVGDVQQANMGSERL